MRFLLPANAELVLAGGSGAAPALANKKSGGDKFLNASNECSLRDSVAFGGLSGKLKAPEALCLYGHGYVTKS